MSELFIEVEHEEEKSVPGRHTASEALALQKAGRVREVVELDRDVALEREQAAELRHEVAAEIVSGMAFDEPPPEPTLTLDDAPLLMDAAIRSHVTAIEQNPSPRMDAEQERQKKIDADFRDAFNRETGLPGREMGAADAIADRLLDSVVPEVSLEEEQEMEEYLAEADETEDDYYS